MTQAKPTDPNQRRGLGLDRPCSMCGKEIYYNYSGPFEGVCGRCTDRIVAKHRGTTVRRTVVVERVRRSAGLFLVVTLAFLAGAAAAIMFRPYLPF